jgi:hypothetical protein
MLKELGITKCSLRRLIEIFCPAVRCCGWKRGIEFYLTRTRQQVLEQSVPHIQLEISY